MALGRPQRPADSLHLLKESWWQRSGMGLGGQEGRRGGEGTAKRDDRSYPMLFILCSIALPSQGFPNLPGSPLCCALFQSEQLTLKMARLLGNNKEGSRPFPGWSRRTGHWALSLLGQSRGFDRTKFTLYAQQTSTAAAAITLAT